MLTVVLLALSTAVPTPAADSLGAVTFENSGNAAAQVPFLTGVRLLHSFEYASAAAEFRAAQDADPTFTLAKWGEAMTHFHLVWNEEDLAAARSVLRIGPDGRSRLPRAATDREQRYIDAAVVLASLDSAPVRRAAYADAMRELARDYPDDIDAQALYAVALLGTAGGRRDIAVYMRAAAVAEEAFARAPTHPGAAHYLIHAYDDPTHAPLGLRAARVYSDIAPGAPHALHMPSHIFLALGDWDAVVASNRASAAAASRKLAAGNRDGLGARNHALYWLTYALLQRGDWHSAREVVRTLERAADSSTDGNTRWHAATARAVYLIEAPAPDVAMLARAEASSAQGRLGATEALAVAIARRSVKSDTRRQPTSFPVVDSDDVITRILNLERTALHLEAQAHRDSAVAILRVAADVEEAQPIDYGPPTAIKPAAELLGEMLLRSGRADEAATAFRRALVRAPNRRASIAGLDAARLASRR